MDRKHLDRLAVVVVGLTILLASRVMQALPSAPELAVADVCCLAMAWRLWDLARRGLLTGIWYERSVVVVATALAASFGSKMLVQADASQTAGVVGMLAVAVTLLTSPTYVRLARRSQRLRVAGRGSDDS